MDYFEKLSKCLLQIENGNIDRLITLLSFAHDSYSTVFIAGNGGSAATASHFATDLSKSVTENLLWDDGFTAISLSDNTSMITAIGNDIDYRDIFSFQLERIGREGDLLICLSVSGTSPNLIRAGTVARMNCMDVVSLTGQIMPDITNNATKHKEHLLDVSDFIIEVPSDDYGIVEDCHMAILHNIASKMKNM